MKFYKIFTKDLEDENGLKYEVGKWNIKPKKKLDMFCKEDMYTCFDSPLKSLNSMYIDENSRIFEVLIDKDCMLVETLENDNTIIKKCGTVKMKLEKEIDLFSWIEENKDNIDYYSWEILVRSVKLSEEFIMKYYDYLNTVLVAICQHELSEQLIRYIVNKIDFDSCIYEYLCVFQQRVSEDFIIDNIISKVKDILYVLKSRKFSVSFTEKLIKKGYVDFNSVLSLGCATEDFIIKNKELIDECNVDIVLEYNNISNNGLDEILEGMSSKSLKQDFIFYAIYYQSRFLSDVFITKYAKLFRKFMKDNVINVDKYIDNIEEKNKFYECFSYCIFDRHKRIFKYVEKYYG